MDIDPAYADLIGKLESLPGLQRKKALRKSLLAVGELLEGVIKATAPVQTEEGHGELKPGELRDSFKARVHISSDENVATDGDFVKVAPSREVMDIALSVETGHNNRARNVASKRARVERTPAHPFVRPAFDATKDAALFVFEETMVKEIKKVLNA